MDFEIVCSTWIKPEDEKVLNALKQSDRWLSVEELSEITGIHPKRVERTIRQLARQIKMRNCRKRLLADWFSD